MIKEYFQKPYYFFLNKTNEGYILHFSVSETIVEARKSEEKIKVPKNKVSSVKEYIKNLKNKKKHKKEIKKEIEELVDSDGSFSNSSVPILDPNIYPKKTMDQTVVTGRITNDPVTRGYRTYYGESIGEIDMSKAFGYEETKDMDGKETYEYLKKEMGMDDDSAKQRTMEFGKDPTGKKDKKSEYEKDKKFITKATLSEIQKGKVIKMLEDILVSKGDKTEDVNKKELSASNILMKNIKALKKQGEKEGLSVSDLIKLIRK